MTASGDVYPADSSSRSSLKNWFKFKLLPCRLAAVAATSANIGQVFVCSPSCAHPVWDCWVGLLQWSWSHPF